MQRPSKFLDALADVLPHWASPWQTFPVPFHNPHGYVYRGLPACQPKNLCPELVGRFFPREAEERPAERERPMQTAVVSMMCWLHNAGSAAIDTFPGSGPMSFDLEAIVQSLGLLVCKTPAACVYCGCSASMSKAVLLCTVLC